MKRAILITTQNETLPMALSDTLREEVAEIQEAIGGYLEAIRHDLPNLTAFCDDDGKRKNRPLNRLATALFGSPNDPIVGNVVVMGPVNDDGDTEGLTVEQIDIFLSDNNDLLNRLIDSRGN